MKRHILTAILAAGFVASGAEAADSAPAAVLKLEPYRKTVAIRVVLNGQAGLFTFDTAGGVTVISPAMAKAAGCSPWGQLVGHQMTGNKLSMMRCDDILLKASGVDLKVPVAGVLDVTPLIAKDAAPVDGSLALDVFDGKIITMDAAAGRLVIETPESMKAAIVGAREIPVKIGREVGGVALTVLAQIPTAKGLLGFEIDSGNGGTILVSKSNASLLGLDPEKGPQHASFQIAEGVTAQAVMFTPELLIDGNIGMPFLKDWAVTLDLREGRMWVKRSKATPPKGMGEAPALPN